MKADRQSRMWPYVGLLLCLFALSVTAPRAWQRAALRYRQGENSHQPSKNPEQPWEASRGPSHHTDPTQAEVATPRPAPSSESVDVVSDTPRTYVRVSSSNERLAMRVPHVVEPPVQTDSVLLPQNEPELSAPAESADPAVLEPVDTSDIATPDLNTPDLQAPADAPATPELSEPEPDSAEVSSLEDSESEVKESSPADVIATDEQDPETDSVPGAESSGDVPSEEPQDQSNSLAWAAPQLLLEQMTTLEQNPAAADWVARTRSLIERLSSRPVPDSNVRTQLLGELQDARLKIEQMAAIEQEWTKKAILLRVQYALSRRLEIWQAIHVLGIPLQSQVATDGHSGQLPDSGEIDLCRLLGQLEEFESARLPHVAKSISEQRQSLESSRSEVEQALGKRIEQHYRNANVRLAISEDLMNRFVPKPQVFDAPVDDMIMGASVSGNSRTLNRLHLRVIPDDRKIRLGLEAHGVVHSNTGASSGPVTIYNQGETTYVGRKLVLISPTGLHVWPAVAEANAASSTKGIESKYDSIPLLNSIVRNMAQTQQDEAYDQAMTEVEVRVEETVRQRLDKEANPRINKLSQDYVKRLQGPLERLDLSPTPISLSTTEDRAIVRFRVAGDKQLGAHTPRPCAPSDSLASVQVHESVLNNAADQLGLNGETFALPELHHTIADKLGLTTPVPDDLPEDARVTFAEEDAVLIRCDDGKIWVTLSIAELSQGRRSFKNFKATAIYHLVSHGLHTELERDGVVRLVGKRLSLGDQIALRGIISKIFTQNRRPQVISAEQAADPRMAGLRVSQLVVVDGWIGLAIAPDQLARTKPKAGTAVNR
jgi:hypothetical protein